MGENISSTRSPDKIRDDAIQWFNTIAPLKYNEGQAKSEVTDNLDKHPDLIGALGEEIVDAVFYLGSLSHQIQKKDSRIAELEKQVEFYKELSQR